VERADAEVVVARAADTDAGKRNSECRFQNSEFCNMSVEFLKQVEISGKQPYFQPNFSEQNNLSSNESPPIPTLLPHLFF
jgi:hypothetical protein